MSRILCPLFFALALASQVFAQATVSVDESMGRNADKSLLASLALTALLPGTGQLYLGREDYLQAYLWTDAGAWMVLAASYFWGEQQLASARDYAIRYGNAASSVPKDLNFLETMGDYRSRGGPLYQNSKPDNDEDYNQARIRAGEDPNSSYPAAWTWDWGSSDSPESSAHLDAYNKMLRNHRISKIVFQVSIGALALNRVVSLLDVFHLYRTTSVQIAPILGPSGGAGAALMVQKSW
jgi:hypothetical protein